MTAKDVESVLKQFASQRALVIGDICLDRWCRYDPAEAEPSRETGIPRIAVLTTETTPGAGGTVANNLAALGAGKVAVLGILGDDGHGYELRQALARRQIDHSLCLFTREWNTFTYTKLLNRETGAEDKPRVDFINTAPLPTHLEEQFLVRFRQAAPTFDVILVSDQAETGAGGVVTEAVRNEIAHFARSSPATVVWVDSRRRPELFRGVIVKPNEEEAAEACLRALGRVDYVQLQALIGGPLLVVTLGPKGAVIVQDGQQSWIPTHPVEHPVDICGAGDSFSAGAALAFSVCRNAAWAVTLGNLVASVTIMKKGTGTATPDEVQEAARRLL
ncbi:MAG: PfkB family carbohydrate kinase [Bryobacteraceae bacterium]|nr:PfkB family carbohydrate kinase [Bryobacteraceae bacterium]MDW8379311.1 PfkB family carbohydrate kinase [Bryobacterales bacterium]